MSVVLITLLVPYHAHAQDLAAKVSAALTEMDNWLSQDPQAADGWHAALQTDRLRAQLARGTGADPAVVMEVLRCYAGNAAGLQSPRFVQVRNAMAEWLASLPSPHSGQLAEATRASKTVFLPRTTTDLKHARQRLAAALQKLETRLERSGDRGSAWRSYLKLDELARQIAQPAPDAASLEAIYAQFASGHEGLQLAEFADVRKTLRRYVSARRSMDDPNARKQYEQLLDSLAQRLEAYQKEPTPGNAAAIADGIGWLRDLGQAPWLIATIRRELSLPNAMVDVSQQLVFNRLSQTVNDTSPVRDCILGTTLYGSAHTFGQIGGELVPSETQAVIETTFSGKLRSNSIGYNGPATIYSSSQSNLNARKRILLDANGLSNLPTCSDATTHSDISCIDTGGRRLVEKIAWRRAMSEKSEAEAIASQHIERRFNERMDQQADPQITKASEGFQTRFRRPLENRNLFPEYFRASTTPQSLRITVMTTGENGLGAPTSPPDLPAAADFAIRVHESSVNNLTAQALAGLTLDEKRFKQIAQWFLKLPEEDGKTQDNENWTITFARQQPITLQFANGGFTVTIRGDQYSSEGNNYPAMNVMVRYRIERAAHGFRAVRQGQIDAYPPGFVPESGEPLSTRESTLRTVLQQRFAQFFKEELPIRTIVAGKDSRHPLELEITDWQADRGWTEMIWQMPSSSHKQPISHVSMAEQ